MSQPQHKVESIYFALSIPSVTKSNIIDAWTKVPSIGRHTDPTTTKKKKINDEWVQTPSFGRQTDPT